MKIKRLGLYILIFLFAPLFLYAASEKQLSKIEILGKEYYYYEAQKGESLYGIAKKFGWDPEELVRLNPNVAGDLKKGDKLYYPTGKVAVVTDMSGVLPQADEDLDPIIHIVKKGETVYGIAHQYNIPLDIIYNANPSARSGIKKGEKLTLPQSPNAKFYFYEIKKDDNLQDIAKRFNTSIENILKNNAGLSAKTFKAGEIIRISRNSNNRLIKTDLVEEEQITSIDSYKIKKDDTWATISEETGVNEEILKNANEDISELKKNDVIAVPKVETVQIEVNSIEEDPREQTEEGIREIYEEVHSTSQTEEEAGKVNIAVILDDPTSVKDIEFTRGFLMALSDFENSEYEIEFKVIDGRISTGSLINELDNFEPNIVFATADKTFPAFLADYGETNNIEIVNVFDVKNDLFEESPSMIQLLPPHAYFNEHIAERIYKDHKGDKLILVGDETDNDGIADVLVTVFPEERIENLSVAAFGEYTPEELESYIIYSFVSKKEEVADVMQGISNIMENNPDVRISVIGRQNWITFTDDFLDKFYSANIMIPSRVWLDNESSSWKNFREKYEIMYGGEPVKSFPNFAVSGFDVANYFIPVVSLNGGDFNRAMRNSSFKALQADINLERINNWGGFINPTSYLIEFRPEEYINRIIVK